MPAPYHYYVYPFGLNADDLTAIPDSAAGDGSVSYFAGWTDPYELNLLTDPTALPIPRGQMNQLFYDITNNLQQYQQFGSPPWVVGNTVSYPIYARVYYLGTVYESQIGSNLNTPGTDDTWLVISGTAEGVPIGSILDYGSPIAPTNYLNCDGSAISRTTFADLLGKISFTEAGTLTNTVNTVSGLTNATTRMYVGMAIEGTNIPSGTTIASIVDANNITMSNTATGSGSSTIRFFTWGNGNGTTTFNLPDFRRATAIGSGGSGSSVVGNVVGQSGGEEAHTQSIAEMPAHNHSGSVGGLAATAGSSNGAIQGNTATSFAQTLQIASQGGGTAFNVMQPSLVTFKIIKYI